MSNPRTKRQFAGASADPAQRQITSFFGACGPGDLAVEPPAQSRQPLLPSTVQANLLSVGMRVRKSVPEGYKTIGHSAFKLWTDNTPLTTGSTPASSLRATSRELLPFCGINKVGGLESQPAFRLDDDEEFAMDVPDLDAVPELTMSQESVESNASESSRKRVYSDDEFDDQEFPAMWSAPSKAWDGEVSPRSFAPSHPNARVMAVPKSRARKSVQFNDLELDQENMTANNDFEEAEFLAFGREMDTSG